MEAGLRRTAARTARNRTKALDGPVSSEERARRLLLDLCWPDGVRRCPRCGHDKDYALSSGRVRCAGCRYTYHDFTGRWINNGCLSCSDWLRLLSSFEAEHTARETAKVLGLSYNTVYKAFNTIRFSILAHAMDARQMLGRGSHLGLVPDGRAAGGGAGMRPDRSPVFGILERQGRAFVDLVPGFDAQTILHFSHSFQLQVVRRGRIVYTAPYQRYQTLVCCVGDEMALRYLGPGKGRVEIDDSTGFWRFATSRLLRFHGITWQRFPLYIKELEFRYNQRNSELFPRLARYVCDIVPDFD